MALAAAFSAIEVVIATTVLVLRSRGRYEEICAAEQAGSAWARPRVSSHRL
jgi:hypothetical protein